MSLLLPVDKKQSSMIFAGLSIEYFINFLRFEAFASEQKSVDALVRTAFHVPRNQKILDAVLDAVFKKDIQKCQSILNKYKSQNPPVWFEGKDPDTVINAYFEETNPGMALKLLIALFNFRIIPNNEEAFGIFLNKIKKMEQTEKERLLDAYMYGSQMF